MAVGNSEGCIVCYNLNNIKGSELVEPEKVLKICLSYLHSDIAKTDSGNVQFKDGNGIRLCENCFDATMELTQLNERLTNLHKQISDATIGFSLAVLHQRSLTYDLQSKQNAMLTPQNKPIIKLDVSDFSANELTLNSLPVENNIEDTENLQETVHFQVTENIEESVNPKGCQTAPNIPQNSPNIFQGPNTGDIRETENVEASSSGNLLTNRCNMEEHNVVINENLQDTHDTPNINQNTPNILEDAAKTVQETLNTGDFRAVDNVEGSVSGNLLTNCSIEVVNDNLVANVLVEENQNNHVTPSESSAMNPTNKETTSDLLKTVRLPIILIKRVSMAATKRAQTNRTDTSESESAPGSFSRNPRNLRPRIAQRKNENTSGRATLFSSTSKKNEHDIVGLRQSRMKKLIQNSRRYAERKTALFKCNKCAQVFPSNMKLKIHLRFHAGKCLYQCSFCTKEFTCQSLCTSHEASHLQEKLFRCQLCNKRFKYAKNLKTHEKIHTGDHHCSYCENSFSELRHLRQHEKIHTGELFECTICGNLYAQLHYLRTHERIHTGQLLFKCTICGKSFSQKPNLYKHERLHAS